jgi:hypothetical protein
MSIGTYLISLVVLGVILGKFIEPFVASVLLSAFFVVGSFFVNPSGTGYGIWLLATLPLLVVFFPATLFTFRLMARRRSAT